MHAFALLECQILAWKFSFSPLGRFMLMKYFSSVKDPGHSIQKWAGGRLHLNTHTPVTQRSRSGLTMPLSRHSVGTYQGNELTRNSSGNTRSQSSQLAEPLWTDPGLKSGISVHELISTLKKKRRRGMNCQIFSQKYSHARRKPTLFVGVRHFFFFFFFSLLGHPVHGDVPKSFGKAFRNRQK